MTGPTTQRRSPQLLRPERLRSIERPFGWLPCRLLSDGWLEALSGPANLLYMLLSTAADRQGLSFYSDARIERVLALGAADLVRARRELTEFDLMAFDGRIYQLLSLPRHPPRPACPSGPRTTPHEPCEPASTANTPSASDEVPEDVQAILRKLLG